MFDSMKWYGHASFSMEYGQKILFLDPFDLKNIKKKADIIFITHAHFDHWSPADIEKIAHDETIIVGVQDCSGLNINRITKPGDRFEVNGLKVRTIPAYNIKPERLSFHPRKNNWVGYIIEMDGKTIYHAGDTDFISEMKSLGKIDLAMLPMGGTYTMDVDEAIQAANTINAKITVPMHYKRLLGAKYKEAEEKFTMAVKGSTILKEFR